MLSQFPLLVEIKIECHMLMNRWQRRRHTLLFLCSDISLTKITVNLT